jgi:antitoxin YefM
MQIASFSEARESFKAVLDRVEADADVTLITRRYAQGAVVMSLNTFNSLMETGHLLRSPANAALLQTRLAQAIGRKPDRQAVPPAVDRLLEVLAGVSRAILRPGLRQGTPSAVHDHL